MHIKNVKVYGLDESARASRYPMTADLTDCAYGITETVKALGSAARGSGHDQFLTGVIVQFDLTCTLKLWTQMQRYHFMDFVSSQSTMHRITQFAPEAQCNEYVDPRVIDILQEKIDGYNADPSQEAYLAILYNIPTGFELTARMTTNYRQLKTIYHQRKNHRLKEWRDFCAWVEELPCFKEICLMGG